MLTCSLLYASTGEPATADSAVVLAVIERREGFDGRKVMRRIIDLVFLLNRWL